jgi:hypothetical protein
VIAYLKNRLALVGAVLIVPLAILAGACGNDNGSQGSPVEPTATVADAGASVPSSGSVAPNTFLTFEGRRYRLMELLQVDLIDESAFEGAGVATEADIDQEDLTVYRKADDPSAVYTYSRGSDSEEVGEGIPALWYRWSQELSE